MEEHKKRSLAADSIITEKGKIILVKRDIDPFKGEWCIPGGHVQYEETVEEAAIRESKEETGLEIELDEILGVYSKPGRDPRGNVVTITFKAHSVGGNLKASTDAAEAKWFDLDNLPDLAFDHKKILRDYREKFM